MENRTPLHLSLNPDWAKNARVVFFVCFLHQNCWVTLLTFSELEAMRYSMVHNPISPHVINTEIVPSRLYCAALCYQKCGCTAYWITQQCNVKTCQMYGGGTDRSQTVVLQSGFVIGWVIRAIPFGWGWMETKNKIHVEGSMIKN